jgi:uncharacterized protein YkwD
MRRLAKWSAGLAAALVLAACSTQPPPPSTIGPVERLSVDPAAARDIISAYRKAHGLGPVMLDPALARVAQAQADTMAAHNQLSHEVAGGLSHRLDAAHLPMGYAVENVSAGYHGTSDVIAGWERSPGHDANLRDAHMRRMGFAAAAAPGTRYGTFWALVMTD